MINKEKVDTILYFFDYGKGFGGACTTLLQQAVLMKQAGHRVVIFFSDYLGREMKEEYREICVQSEIEWIWITYEISSQPENINIVCLNRNYENLRTVIESYQPDILHSMQINPGVELVSRELGIPHIMNIYQLLPEFFSIDYIDIFPHYHICDSNYYADQWKHYLGTDSVCIRTTVNRRIERRRAIQPSFLKFICVGTCYERKNQLSVIKAFHKAVESGIRGRLVLYGYMKGKYADVCAGYVQEKGLADKIILKGFCSDMEAVYAENDVLICGSTVESYPNVISEAMAYGLVVISTPVAGVPEVLKDGVNGYLTKDYSAEGIYGKIMEFCKDLGTNKLDNIMRNGEESFQRYHSPQRVTRQLESYYRYVLEDYHKIKRDKQTGIKDIRDIFDKMLTVFASHEKEFTNKKKAESRLWYIYHTKNTIMSALCEDAKFYIWGAGKDGVLVKQLIDVFLPEIYVNGFLDSNKGGMFMEYKIYNPNDILQRDNVVIFIAVTKGQEEITEKLKKRGKIFNKDYFILSNRVW